MSHELEFPDKFFDYVYSQSLRIAHTVLETLEAQAALRVQVKEIRATVTCVSNVPVGESSLLPFIKMQRGAV